MRSKFFNFFSNMSNSSVAPVETLSAESQAELEKRKPMDANRYATKKTIAQGMLDIALLTANASQLKYILQSGEKLQFYSLLLWLTSSSILLQVFMGVLFVSLNMLRDLRFHLLEYKASANLLNHIQLGCCFSIAAGVLFLIIGGLNINNKPDRKLAIILNDITLIMIFLISTVNVIISGFGLTTPSISTAPSFN